MSHHEESNALLRERGCRVTPQRLAVLDVLRQKQDHLSAEEIHAGVTARFPGIDPSTVYRILEFLCNQGLARQTFLGAGRIHYEWSEDPIHHHLVCRDCGQVLHISDRLLDGVLKAVEQEFSFRPAETRFTVFGRCRECA